MTPIPITYYIDWSGLESFDYDFDSDGVPRVDYGGSVGLRYSPITVAQYGLHCMGEWEQHDDIKKRDHALNCCRWLYDSAQDGEHDSKVWPFDFDLPFYGPRAPWISAMAQGEAVSLLLRGAVIANRNEYELLCSRALIPFQFPVSDHGVIERLSDGSPIFEEYPTHPPSHVLNGHIFALFGLYDYAVYFDDKNIMALAQKGVNTLKFHWHRWDTGHWTRYDLHPTHRLASAMYHELHIRQFSVLSTLFEDKILADAARRWRRMQKNPWYRLRWYGSKIREKIQLRGYSQ